MERHRDEQRLLPSTRRSDVAEHEMGERGGEAGATAIFEPERDPARDLAIGDRGAQSVEGRRLGEAAPAFPLAREGEREAAAGAAGLAEEGQPGPAVEAETVRLAGDRSAARAARRKREIDQGAERGAGSGGRGGHGSTVARSGAGFNPAPGQIFPGR
jgi:hypothetical protein